MANAMANELKSIKTHKRSDKSFDFDMRIDENIEADYMVGFDQDEMEMRDGLIEEHKIEENLYGRPDRFDSLIHNKTPTKKNTGLSK